MSPVGASLPGRRPSYWVAGLQARDRGHQGSPPIRGRTIGAVAGWQCVPLYDADAHHRYATSCAASDQMVAKGWLAEGDDADTVVMCAPQ